MTSEAKIAANRKNAQASTGPRTEAGKAASSRNRLTFGLFTHHDFVKQEETEIYKEFCTRFHDELTPEGILEETLVAEITAASWRLRRCAAAEAQIADFRPEDPLLDDSLESTLRSIERARASAHSALNRATSQLRKLQTERITREQLKLGNTEDAPLAESRQICRAVNIHVRNQQFFAKADDLALERQLQEIMSADGPSLEELASNCRNKIAA